MRREHIPMGEAQCRLLDEQKTVLKDVPAPGEGDIWLLIFDGPASVVGAGIYWGGQGS